MRYIYFGHHKCASQYIVGILRDMGRLLHLPACFRTVTDTLPFDYHTHLNFKALTQKRREEALKIENGIIDFENADEKLHKTDIILSSSRQRLMSRIYRMCCCQSLDTGRATLAILAGLQTILPLRGMTLCS